MELEAEGVHHIFIYVDEASFNVSKMRRLGRNIVGQRTTVKVSVMMPFAKYQLLAHTIQTASSYFLMQ